MGNRGICTRCGWEERLGHSVVWKGSLEISYRCGPCKGTRIINPPPAPHIIPASLWPAYARSRLLQH